jgi:hypothetical protein
VENFPSNSRKSREPQPEPVAEKKILRVVEDGSKVVRRKKPLGSRFKELFLDIDVVTIVEDVIKDVLIPAAKDMFTDAVNQSMRRALYGGDDSRNRGYRSYGSGPTNYTRYSSSPPARREEPRSMSRRARAAHDFDEIILGSRQEAEDVLGQMRDVLDRYETVSVGDLYGMVDIQGTSADERWGWLDLHNARVVRVNGGYLLDLPKTEPLN